MPKYKVGNSRFVNRVDRRYNRFFVYGLISGRCLRLSTLGGLSVYFEFRHVEFELQFLN